MDAVVWQALPTAMFEVELENGHKLIAYAAGRMRRYFIRITPGDRIRVELSPYDLSRGRIVYRYRDYPRPPGSAGAERREGAAPGQALLRLGPRPAATVSTPGGVATGRPVGTRQ